MEQQITNKVNVCCHELVIADCDLYKTPVFVKEPLASYSGIMRQEYPKGR